MNFRIIFFAFSCFFFSTAWGQEEDNSLKEKKTTPKKSSTVKNTKNANSSAKNLTKEIQKLQEDLRKDFKIKDWFPAERKVRKISLQECIELCLVHNLDLRVESHNPKLAEDDIIAARSRFDTTFFTGISATESTRETGSALQGSESHNISYNAGLKKEVYTGGSIELRFNSARDRTDNSFVSLNPSWGSDLTFSITQPLLKGLGWELSRINIRNSENRLELAHIAFEGKVISLVQQVKKSYWDLVFSIADLKVKQISLELARRLVSINKAKFDAGVIAKIEIIQAETDVAVRKEQVIFAQSAIEDNEEILKQLINPIEDSFLYEITLRPTDSPRFEKKEVRIQESTKIALTNRPELKRLEIELNNIRLEIQQAQNNLLPSLNLTGSVGLSGLQGNFANSVDSTFSGDQWEWSTGLVFEYPLGNRDARAKFRQAKRQKRQKQDELLAQVSDIKFEISRLLRSISTLESSINASIESTRLAKEQLVSEEQRFSVGLSTNFRVSEVQEDYITSLNRLLKAIVDYEKALVDLDAAQSTILENSNINLERK